jgi:hypothetical protein
MTEPTMTMLLEAIGALDAKVERLIDLLSEEEPAEADPNASLDDPWIGDPKEAQSL